MRKSSPQLFRKLEKLLDELREHPYTGTGHPEQLRYLEGVWSRQLDKKNRIRYMVNETYTQLNGCTRRECWYTPLPCGAPRPMSFLCCSGHVLLCGFVG